MPFDPNLPRPNTPLDADEMRGQLNGLKTLIDAVPAGGIGGSGSAGALAQWTDDHTLGESFVLVLKDRAPLGGWTCNTLAIPAPSAGGNPLYIDVDSNGNFAFRNTASGTGESVWVSADGVWHFMAGIQTPAGIVTNEALGTAIAGTANNPASVGPYTGDFSDPPTQGEMRAFASYVEGLRAALVR